MDDVNVRPAQRVRRRSGNFQRGILRAGMLRRLVATSLALDSSTSNIKGNEAEKHLMKGEELASEGEWDKATGFGLQIVTAAEDNSGGSAMKFSYAPAGGLALLNIMRQNFRGPCP